MSRTCRIITMSGPSSAGKSTVASLLTKIAMIELDDIGQTAKVLPREDRGQCIFEDAAAVAINWFDRGFDVVITGAFWGLKPLQVALGPRLGWHQIEYYSFVLAPPMEVALQTRGPRTLSDEDRNWVRQTYELTLHNPGFGTIIDNQAETPEQTAERIAGYISDGLARAEPAKGRAWPLQCMCEGLWMSSRRPGNPWRQRRYPTILSSLERQPAWPMLRGDYQSPCPCP